jgi:hypothetical protein
LDADSHADFLHRAGRRVDRRQVQAANAIPGPSRIPAPSSVRCRPQRDTGGIAQDNLRLAADIGDFDGV